MKTKVTLTAVMIAALFNANAQNPIFAAENPLPEAKEIAHKSLTLEYYLAQNNLQNIFGNQTAALIRTKLNTANIDMSQSIYILEEQIINMIEEALSETNFNIQDKDDSGRTPLLRSIMNTYVAPCRALLKFRPEEYKAIINAHENKNGLTALMLAAVKGDLEIVKLLRDFDADVNYENKNGLTVLMCAAGKAHLDVVRFLIASGADVNRVSNAGMTPLMIAAQNGHLDVVKLLRDFDADIDCKGKDGWTALMSAVSNVHLDVVKRLRDFGADVNCANNGGKTPLMFAAEKGYLEIVQFLLDSRADVNCARLDGVTALMIAANNGHLEIVKLLRDFGADVNHAKNDRWTVLMSAAENGYLEVVQFLLDSRADVNRARLDGVTALIMAAQNGHLDVVKRLQDFGADVNHAMNDGWTSLLYAARNGHLEIVETLINAGADVNRARWDGITPLMITANNGHLDVVTALLNADGILVDRKSQGTIRDLISNQRISIQEMNRPLKNGVTLFDVVQKNLTHTNLEQRAIYRTLFDGFNERGKIEIHQKARSDHAHELIRHAIPGVETLGFFKALVLREWGLGAQALKRAEASRKRF